ncbi:hypothetical protein ACWGH7_11520 [Streptomyces cyaneofuscatus]|uniref:hypothetical protein n=2 Tax=Streptomyces TaxID=1883 RepID=UPI0004C8FFBF|nr:MULTISPECIES: hypothetical protein [Streptomyces]CAD5911199.1 conserved protein of unknown function [Streptomyces sp. KY70]CAD5995568.1 conserved protein of unknown function [Streptomyces sp. KY75]
MHLTDILVIVSALTAGCLAGRLQPWRRLGGWAVDQIRHTGPWVRNGRGRQAAVALAQVLTAPRTSWRIVRTPITGGREPAPVRDPEWIANRTRSTTDQEGTT